MVEVRWLNRQNSCFGEHHWIVAPANTTKLMSSTTVLLESVTESMLQNRCLQPTVIIFIVISTSHNFEIQTVNSNLTLNPMINSNLKVFFLTLNPMVNSNLKVIFCLTLNPMVNSNLKVIFLNFKPNAKFKPKGQNFEFKLKSHSCSINMAIFSLISIQFYKIIYSIRFLFSLNGFPL